MVPGGRVPSAAAERRKYESTSGTVLPRPCVTPSIVLSKYRWPFVTSFVLSPLESHKYRDRKPREGTVASDAHCSSFALLGLGTYQLIFGNTTADCFSVTKGSI